MDSTDDQIETLAILAGASFVLLLLHETLKNRRRGIHPYLKERRNKGRFAKDFEDLAKYPDKFKENFRMDKVTFDELLKRVEPYLTATINLRPHDSISPKEKLAMVLEYLACGSLQRHMASVYRISKQHVGLILYQVCSAICTALFDEVSELLPLKMIEVANQFNYKWQFPNCVGAIDGKHVAIKCPAKSGSMFYNYKGFHSINLMAIADANYKFLYYDVGAYGSEGDAGVFGNSKLGQALFDGKLKFSEDATIGLHKMPFSFVGDDAFPLHKRIM